MKDEMTVGIYRLDAAIDEPMAMILDHEGTRSECSSFETATSYDSLS